MSFDAIKQEISGWDDEQLSRLAALVKAIRQVRDPAFREALGRKMDQAADAWITGEDAARRLGFAPERAQ